MKHSDSKQFSKEIELKGKFFNVDFTVYYTVTQDNDDYWTPPGHDLKIDHIIFESIEKFDSDGNPEEYTVYDKMDLYWKVKNLDLDFN